MTTENGNSTTRSYSSQRSTNTEEKWTSAGIGGIVFLGGTVWLIVALGDQKRARERGPQPVFGGYPYPPAAGYGLPPGPQYSYPGPQHPVPGPGFPAPQQFYAPPPVGPIPDPEPPRPAAHKPPIEHSTLLHPPTEAHPYPTRDPKPH
ncbi:hypothetical protein [Nocardia sp. NPDC057668]|uniref:hypothetical protein n=1 Tax=Nocardia sp. NPDC057668 TaxID=3346202 RepID=UPI00366FC0BF